MKKGLAGLLLLIICISAKAQDFPFTDSLKQNLAQAKTVKERLIWLRELSSFYTNLNNELADQYASQQLQIAEESRDRKLMAFALLSNAYRLFLSANTQNFIVRGQDFSKRALELSKSSNLTEETAWSYLYLAWGNRLNNEKDEAINNDNLALAITTTISNDSLKVFALNSLGDTYLSRNDKLLAFRNYLQAVDLAETSGNYDLILRCYYNMADFYASLDDYEKSKDFLFKIFKLAKENQKPYDRLNLYNKLGRIYTRNKQYDLATSYYEKAIALSDTLKFEIYKINSYFNIVNQYINSNQGEKALAYFKEKKELRDFIHQSGVDYYAEYAYALAYADVGKFDSAKFYFERAEKPFVAKASTGNTCSFYSSYANYFEKRGDNKSALMYYQKAYDISNSMGDIKLLKNVSSHLDTVYAKLGDFKNAHFFQTKFVQFDDSLQKLATEKDLMLLEVDNENKRKEREAALAEQRVRDRHNIQYMGITIAIALVFIVLVMLGIFSVSKTTIRILGFFAFIFLFEFIILLADHQIHHWTHGEPWKIMALKIILISLLLPLHHYLEEKVIHYLTSRKMLEVKPKIFAKLTGAKQQVDEA